MHEFFLRYRRYRHLKCSLLAVAVATAAYLLHTPVTGRGGGTWVGYGLGVAAALLILWLMWFGVRKRSYHAAAGPLRGVLSAHVYWGLALLFLVPLHSAFQFGWNVHTLAYVLMAVVVLSGIAGVILYGTIPQEMTRNRPGEKMESLLRRVAEADAECKQLAAQLPDTFAQAVAHSIRETRIGGGILAQLSAADARCPTAAAIETIQARAREVPGEAREAVRRLQELLEGKRQLLQRVRRDVRLKALLELWLKVHVPFSFATVAAVAIHVFAVFYYR